MDYLTISDFSIHGVHGYQEHERHVEQEFNVSLTVGFDAQKAGKSDALPDTIDFEFLKSVVRETFEGRKYYLVEALAEDIAVRVLADARAKEVTVSIQKKAVWGDAVPGITITRMR